MVVKYLSDIEEYIIETQNRRFRASYFHGRYILEEIDRDDVLQFVDLYDTIGEILELCMHIDIGSPPKRKEGE